MVVRDWRVHLKSECSHRSAPETTLRHQRCVVFTEVFADVEQAKEELRLGWDRYRSADETAR